MYLCEINYIFLNQEDYFTCYTEHSRGGIFLIFSLFFMAKVYSWMCLIQLVIWPSHFDPHCLFITGRLITFCFSFLFSNKQTKDPFWKLLLLAEFCVNKKRYFLIRKCCIFLWKSHHSRVFCIVKRRKEVVLEALQFSYIAAHRLFRSK